MPQAHYSPGEIAWLLSLTYEEAVSADASPVSSTGQLSGDGTSGSADGPQVPVIARWNDVRRARQIVREKRDQEILELRVAGETEQEVAAKVGLSQQTVSRRFRASLRDILDELGGPASPEEVESRLSLCLECGDRPRARARARYRRVRGKGLVEIAEERQLALCEQCLPADHPPLVSEVE